VDRRKISTAQADQDNKSSRFIDEPELSHVVADPIH